MSRELASAFFKRDLSEAEADALEAGLAEDPAVAEALLAAAAEHYQATGLPEPRWVRRRPRARGRFWLLGAVLLGGAALFALSREHSSAHVMDVAEADDALPVVEGRQAARVDEALAKVEADERAARTGKAGVAAKDEAAAAEDESGAKVAAARAAKTPPQPEGGSRSGHSLGVVLRLKEAAKLLVVVEDGRRQACRHLFRGAVSAGQLRFEWDGLDDAGRRLPPGDYQVHISGPGIDMARSLTLKESGR